MESIELKTIKDPYLIKKATELQFLFDNLNKTIFKKSLTAIKFALSYPKFVLNQEFHFNRKTRTWHLNTGEIVMYEVNLKKNQEKPNGIVFNKWNQKWYDTHGNDIWQDECDHLSIQIAETFNLKIKNKNWQHWNGGVFLFNDQSEDFLNTWHQKTMHIFTQLTWKTRDQGTLIATAWEFGLSNHPTLSKKWNFIADYFNNGLMLNSNEGILTDDGFNTSYKPSFMHVYHNWGKQDWEIWQWIENKIS
jgi:HD superfamily phosphohydrolase YqeK